VVRLNAEITRALAAPDVREKLAAQGFTVRGTSQEELGSITRAQLARYAKVMKEAGIKAE
jgi:tripartite-type tricarboxylate transporter receptor subunit TctC